MNINVSTGSKWIDFASKRLKSVWIVPVVGLLLALLGGILEYFYGYDLFQRFGSVMVVFVLIVIFIHYFIRHYSDQRRESANTLKSVKANPVRMQQVLSQMPANSRQSIIASWDELIEKSEELDSDLKSSSKSLALGELFVGVSGTLIWGFGDLLVCAISTACKCT